VGEASGDFSIGGNLWPGISKLIEECGEVGQVAGKLIGNEGRTDHWDGTDLRERLEDEMADVIAAIDFVTSLNGLSAARITQRAGKKLALFNSWHRNQQTESADDAD
jgi:NTP pyrophosphatase (non-canonical NTP hydrolase)